MAKIAGEPEHAQRFLLFWKTDQLQQEAIAFNTCANMI